MNDKWRKRVLLVTAALLLRECKGVLMEDKTTSRREKDGVEAKGFLKCFSKVVLFTSGHCNIFQPQDKT